MLRHAALLLLSATAAQAQDVKPSGKMVNGGTVGLAHLCPARLRSVLFFFLKKKKNRRSPF